MVIVKLRIKMRPSERANALDLFESFIGPVLVQPGCINASLYSDINNDDDLVLLEEWKSKRDLERHILSDDFQIFLAIMELADELPEISFHVISSSMGMELIKRVREKKKKCGRNRDQLPG